MRCIDIPGRYVPSYRRGSSRSGPPASPCETHACPSHLPAAPLCSQLLPPRRQYL